VDDSRFRKGIDAMNRIMGMSLPASPALAESPFLRITAEHLFGEVWSREELPVRDRRLVVLVIVACLGQQEYLKLHLEQALRQGELSRREIEEVALQITHYAGWPRGTLFHQTAQAVFAEVGEDAAGS
jgi:4-carboxymuconolactone decarboxylase